MVKAAVQAEVTTVAGMVVQKVMVMEARLVTVRMVGDEAVFEEALMAAVVAMEKVGATKEESTAVV